ncbi:phospholipid/cholesterol/gamma-HCH transport system substrate-binding protein [Kibdelosporangium banguiense]|uniref:Phospholipid/cholesterol/gamma-HCH transport system substrate-binding protein n=1 Tax=Kibdelosporangium banguiense TaxID=1365924 RepID=A0ABS4TDD5_9PSEU|nr:MCE family protein [Kibdelosporangium banguiense]MBP2322440.1 phospholipid/cholesterol/gamma-HCH transport system substrate-binding protein [Kibdelosporangium banguiense]
MKSFRSRNPITIAVAGLVVIALALLAAVYSDDLPIIGGGTTYQAQFSEAAGIKPTDEVRIAGVKVGKVTDVDLVGDSVLVSFKVKDAWVGDRTRAAIKIKTLLGQKFLSLEPDGSTVLDPGKPIPRNRTLAPYDVLEAFRGLAETVDAVDTPQLAKSFEVLSQTFSNTPDNVKGALDGLSALSKTVSSRDQELAKLLDNTAKITQTLADRDAEVQKLLEDGNKLLDEVRKRKQAISALLDGTKKLSAELKGLVDDNAKQLDPVLTQLDQFTAMLQRNQDDLGKGIEKLAPFVRQFTNTLGNGRWFDNYICGLLPPSIGPINPQGCLP